MVDMTDGSDVDVRLGALELGLGHVRSPLSCAVRRCADRLLRLVLFCCCDPRLFAASFRDDLRCHGLRDLGVGVELHAVTRSALCATAKVAHVAEHLRQRNECLDDASARTLLHRLHLTTSRVQVTDDVAHEVLWRGDFDGHHRFEKRRLGAVGCVLKRH